MLAVVAALIGGIVGFISFLVALIFYDASFLWALAVYSGVGTSFAFFMIASLMLLRWSAGRDQHPGPEVEHPDHAQQPQVVTARN